MPTAFARDALKANEFIRTSCVFNASVEADIRTCVPQIMTEIHTFYFEGQQDFQNYLSGYEILPNGEFLLCAQYTIQRSLSELAKSKEPYSVCKD